MFETNDTHDWNLKSNPCTICTPVEMKAVQGGNIIYESRNVITYLSDHPESSKWNPICL